MTSHENKLFILNNEHCWHKCESKVIDDIINTDYYRNTYIKEYNYFICSCRYCNFKFPTILAGQPTEIQHLHNNIIVYRFGPPYAVLWCHIEHHKFGYIELDISEFLNI